MRIFHAKGKYSPFLNYEAPALAVALKVWAEIAQCGEVGAVPGVGASREFICISKYVNLLYFIEDDSASGYQLSRFIIVTPIEFRKRNFDKKNLDTRAELIILIYCYLIYCLIKRETVYNQYDPRNRN